MTATPQLSNWLNFGPRRNRQLVSIIDNALEVGLLLAANEADVDLVGVLHRRAADIYADTVMLVEKVEAARDRKRLQERVGRLRDALDRRVADGITVEQRLQGGKIRCSSLREVTSGLPFSRAAQPSCEW